MAEFVDVMKIAKRICARASDCNDCPIYDSFSGYCKLSRPVFSSDSDFAKCEVAIMEWGTENPELRYPTWEEWQRQTFPDAPRFILPCMFVGVIDGYCSIHNCHECAKHHIPADVAKKLGIQPIAKENSG